MTDDSVRNIEVFQKKIIQKINHTNDRPMKRDKKEKGYNSEREKDSHDLRNPFYTLGNPEYLANKILYEDDIQDMFLKVKLEQPLHHEDDRHLVNDHQYEGTHD